MSAAYRTFETVTFWPIFHFRLEFAAVVRRALLAAQARGEAPDAVAVELPGPWREAVWQGVHRLPYLSLILDEQGDTHLYLPVEPTDGCIEALRTAKGLGIAAELIDLDIDDYPFHRDPLPDPYPVHRLGYDRVMAAALAEGRFPRHPLDDARETMMAHALQQLAAGGRRVWCVLGAAHLHGVMERLATPQPRPLARARPRRLRLYNWSEKSSQEYLHEPPFLAAAYERARRMDPPAPVDRDAEAERLLREAARACEAETAVPIPPGRYAQLGGFARKYALVEGQLVPDLYQLVVAARGVVDDGYARHVWEQGSLYPWQDALGALPTVDLDETHANVGKRRLTLRRKLQRPRPRLRGITDRRRLRERYPGQWKSKWSGRVICSHVPEDLVIEEFGRYLQHKARGMLAAEETRVEPFAVSLKDGLDVRETLRHWHQGTLYVREERRVAGEVGSLVVVFDEDRLPAGHPFGRERYPWRVTWLGEHEQESDMAFYASEAGEVVVGPGIARCEYGGFMMTYPPQRVLDVWSDPFFDAARNKAERLLLAGLDYAEKPLVVYVAERPPRSWFRTVAGRMGKRLVYLPLGQIPPRAQRRVRTFHVLEGHSVRAYAGDYIGR